MQIYDSGLKGYLYKHTFSKQDSINLFRFIDKRLET